MNLVHKSFSFKELVTLANKTEMQDAADQSSQIHFWRLYNTGHTMCNSTDALAIEIDLTLK